MEVNDQSSEQSNPGYDWLATDAEVADVASRLGIPLAPGDVREITESFSRIFVFGGDDGEQRVLKIRARWMTEGRIGFEHALARHLRGHGLPMVAPLEIEGGCTWARVGDLFCEIAPHVDGRKAEQSLADVRLMGQLLGHFHVCVRSFDASLYEPPHFRNQVEPRELEQEVTQLPQQLRERWEELVACYERQGVPSLPQVIRHGDYHPWNMLFSQDEPRGIAALFDLDMSAWGPRIYDVSYAIFFLRNLHPEWNGEGWSTRYRQFIEGYAETCGMPIREDEAAVVPLLMECIAFGFVAQAQAEDAESHSANYTALVEWLESWRPELTGMLGG